MGSPPARLLAPPPHLNPLRAVAVRPGPAGAPAVWLDAWFANEMVRLAAEAAEKEAKKQRKKEAEKKKGKGKKLTKKEQRELEREQKKRELEMQEEGSGLPLLTEPCIQDASN